MDEETIHEEVEGIDHHLSQGTLNRIIEMVQFFSEDDQRLWGLKKFQSGIKEGNFQNVSVKYDGYCSHAT